MGRPVLGQRVFYSEAPTLIRRMVANRKAREEHSSGSKCREGKGGSQSFSRLFQPQLNTRLSRGTVSKGEVGDDRPVSWF